MYGVYLAFRQFGPVHQLISQSSEPRSRSIVLIESARTEQLRQNQKIKCGAIEIPVRCIESNGSQPNGSQSTSSASSEPAYKRRKFTLVHNAAISILDALDDDCLRLIFEQNVLDREDLLTLARTCYRFTDAMRPILRCRHKEGHFEITSREWSLPSCETLLWYLTTSSHRLESVICRSCTHLRILCSV